MRKRTREGNGLEVMTEFKMGRKSSGIRLMDRGQGLIHVLRPPSFVTGTLMAMRMRRTAARCGLLRLGLPWCRHGYPGSRPGVGELH